jgi:hypothetical protein
MNKNLYVILPYYNYFHNIEREKNLLNFIRLYSGIENCKLILIEGIDNESRHLPLDVKHFVHSHIKYNLPQRIWVKENLINLAVRNHLPNDWNYMSWIDSDIYFLNKNWVNQSIELLETNDIIQMFDFSLDQNNSKSQSNATFNVGYINAFMNQNDFFIREFSLKHSGYGWAMNRKFYEKIGGLWEFNIIGSADTIIARSATQNLSREQILMKNQLNVIYSLKYGDQLCEYYDKFNGCKFSFLKSQIYHFFHGKNQHKLYVERHEILKYHDFETSMIKYDENGIIYTDKNDLSLHIENYMNYRENDGVFK